jgi:hypothetical protein
MGTFRCLRCGRRSAAEPGRRNLDSRRRCGDIDGIHEEHIDPLEEGADFLELALLVVIKVGGVAQEPAVCSADRRWPVRWCGRWTGCPPRPDVLADDGVGAAVAQVAQFAVELLSVGAPFVPALAQVGVFAVGPACSTSV